MTSTKEDIDTEFFAMVDWVPTLACESRYHQSAKHGHIPGMPAEYVHRHVACGYVVLMCRGWFEAQAPYRNVYCGGCENTCPRDEFTNTPITIP